MRQSIRRICSKVTFLCGVVTFTTGLTGRVDWSTFSVFLIFCVVCVGFVGSFIVGVRVCLTTTVIVVIIAGTFRFNPGVVFFLFELTALVSIVTWFFAIVASWFGLSGVLLYRLLCSSVYLQFIGGFQIFQFQLPFKMRHNLFICAILQMRLVI